MEHNNASTAATANPRPSSLMTARSSEQLSQKLQEQSRHQQQQQQSQHQHQHQYHQQTQPQQQSNNEHQQQFCLRWHNHQTSLLSTLPILLDQSHLTDVTISAEGRTLRAHRVVLSACSSFFLEIFRTLDTTHHPVIIIPGASFQAIVSLLTFMYSGEVNVYEEQIPTLLSLAETLGIKGLADVHNNLQKTHKATVEKDTEEPEKSLTPPTPPPSSSSQTTSGNFTVPQAPVQSPALPTVLPTSPFSPLLNPVLSSKFPSPLENFFLKSLQFYPNLMHQPLNFSQTALNKTSEILAKYQQQCNLYQANLVMNSKDLMPLSQTEEGSRSILADDLHGSKRFCTGLEKKPSISVSNPQHCVQSPLTLQTQKDIKRIDKVIENLRGSSSGVQSGNAKLMGNHENSGSSSLSSHMQNQLSPLSIKTSMENYVATSSAALMPPKTSLFSSPTTAQPNSPLHPQLGFNISAEDQLKLQQHLDKYAASCAAAAAAAGNMADSDNVKQEPRSVSDKMGGTPQSPQNKAPSSSKLYATCFICHKQLSNQYNLRVHLETHQNVRYACNVCSHVSRSKDALRKHVSYRHPGAPSPCETEARRKRANKLLASSINASAAAAAAVAAATSCQGDLTPTSPNTPSLIHQTFQPVSSSLNTMSSDRACTSDTLASSPQQQMSAAAQLNSAYQMFLPNQFHLAAAAANVAAQQHLRENPQSPSTINNTSTTPATTPTKEFGLPGNMPNNMNRSSSPTLQEITKSSATPITTANATTPTSTNSNAASSPTHTTDLRSNALNSLTEARISPSITSP